MSPKTINQYQIISTVAALCVTVFCMTVVALIVKQWWPSEHVSLNYCEWLFLGLIVLTVNNAMPDFPKSGHIDLRGGFRFMWKISVWPVMLSKKN